MLTANVTGKKAGPHLKYIQETEFESKICAVKKKNQWVYYMAQVHGLIAFVYESKYENIQTFPNGLGGREDLF